MGNFCPNFLSQSEDGSVVVPESAMNELYQAKIYGTRENPRIRIPTFPVEDTRFTYASGFFNGMYRGKVSPNGVQQWLDLGYIVDFVKFSKHLKQIPNL